MTISPAIFGNLHRLTASFLLLVMAVPGLAPFAAAGIGPAEGMHCRRMPMAETRAETAPSAAAPRMPCHHAVSESASPESQVSNSPSNTDASFRASDGCCNQNCDCCRNAKISAWARPAASHLALFSLMIETASPAANFRQYSAILVAPDSARAPPRG